MEEVNVFRDINVVSRRDHFYHKLEERLKLDELSMSFAIERNVISTALTNDEYGEIIEKGRLNTFDGSVVALVVGKALKVDIEVLTLADVFTELISRKDTRHFFLGNSSETLMGLKSYIYNQNISIKLISCHCHIFLTIKILISNLFRPKLM